MAKDRVTSFLRAPFTEFQEASGQGEVEEKARAKGLLGQHQAGARRAGHRGELKLR